MEPVRSFKRHISVPMSRCLLVAIGLGTLQSALPQPAEAQPSQASAAPSPPGHGWVPEVSLGAGLGHVFRFDDQSFGNRPALAVGVALAHGSGFALELDASRPFGLTASPAPCAIANNGVPLPCVGTGRNGVLSLETLSIGGRYRFGRGRVAPYLTAALGLMRSHSVWSVARVDGQRVLLSEEARRDTGIGPDLGVGVDVQASRHLTIRPEIRWLEGSALSAVNLSSTRLLVRFVYR